MLTELQVREAQQRRRKIMVPALAIAIIAILTYLLVVGALRGWLISIVAQTISPGVAEFAPIVLIAPAFVIFLAPLLVAEKAVKRSAIGCPLCSVDISRSTQRILATRCCSACGQRIVKGGREHRSEVYIRSCNIEGRRFLKYWFWVWPVFGVVTLALHYNAPSALEDCPQFLFVPGLIGTVAGGWTCLRTWDRRYVPPLVVSFVLLIAGGVAFWRMVE